MTISKLQVGQEFINTGMTHLGELAGNKAIEFYLIQIKIGSNRIAFHLDSNGRNKKLDAYPDVCKPRHNGVEWDQTIFDTEEACRSRAREIFSIEFPELDLSAI